MLIAISNYFTKGQAHIKAKYTFLFVGGMFWAQKKIHLCIKALFLFKYPVLEVCAGVIMFVPRPFQSPFVFSAF